MVNISKIQRVGEWNTIATTIDNNNNHIVQAIENIDKDIQNTVVVSAAQIAVSDGTTLFAALPLYDSGKFQKIEIDKALDYAGLLPAGATFANGQSAADFNVSTETLEGNNVFIYHDDNNVWGVSKIARSEVTKAEFNEVKDIALSDVETVDFSRNVTSNGVNAIGVVNDREADENGRLLTINGIFTGPGICKFIIVSKKYFVGSASGSKWYRFNIKKRFELTIPKAGEQSINVYSLNISLEKGDLMGVEYDSTSQPLYGVDADFGANGYQVNGLIKIDNTSMLVQVPNLTMAFGYSMLAYRDTDNKVFADKTYGTVSETISGDAVGASVAAINSAEIQSSGVIKYISGRFSKKGTVRAFIARSFKSDRFNIVSPFSFEVPAAGFQKIDIEHLGLNVQKGDRIGFQPSSTSLPYYGVDNSVGYGWYQTNKEIDSNTIVYFVSNAVFAFNVTIKTPVFTTIESAPETVKITLQRNAENYNSLRNLIKSITDASEKKQYEIIVPNGEYFECDIQGGKWIKVIGESRAAVLYCDGSDGSKNSPDDYSYPSEAGKKLSDINRQLLHLIFQKNDTHFENITLRQKNGKYVAHIDDKAWSSATYSRVIFEGENVNYPVGIGMWGGQRLEFNQCTFKNIDGVKSGFFIHNQANQKTGTFTIAKNCFFDNTTFPLVDELGSEQQDVLILENCRTNVEKKIDLMVDFNPANGQSLWINPATGTPTSDLTTVPYSFFVDAISTPIDTVQQSYRPNYKRYMI